MANQVNERFAEDYPESYKAADGLRGVTPEEAQQAKLVGQMENLVADLDKRAIAPNADGAPVPLDITTTGRGVRLDREEVV